MKHDMEPLCDRDFTSMEVDQDAYTTFRYVCNSPGCIRAWSPSIGYYNLTCESELGLVCSDHRGGGRQTHMFISAVGEDGQVWTCGCGHSELAKPRG